MIKTLAVTVVKGHQVASGNAENSPFPDSTIAMQKPFFAKQGLNLKEFKNGTVNLVLTCKSVSILRHDYFFQNIKWSPNHAAESFYFIKCVLIKAGIKYPAYIYQPDLKSKIGHFQNKNVLEVIARPIVNLRYGDQLQLEVNSDYLLIET